jgi:hypothetical protein
MIQTKLLANGNDNGLIVVCVAAAGSHICSRENEDAATVAVVGMTRKLTELEPMMGTFHSSPYWVVGLKARAVCLFECLVGEALLRLIVLVCEQHKKKPMMERRLSGSCGKFERRFFVLQRHAHTSSEKFGDL